MVMARVPKDEIRRRETYEFFKGVDSDGNPLWTKHIRDRGAVFVNPGSCYRSGIAYNAGLGRYLWCQTLPFSTDPRGPRFQGGFGICEAPQPWGPWRTPDGRTCHLLFSGDDCFSVRRATLR
jgi:hypothetical protein